MASRMDRYKQSESNDVNTSTVERNYKDNNNKTNASNMLKTNEFDISDIKLNKEASSLSRSNYQKMKHINEIIPIEKEEEKVEIVKEDILFENTFDEKDFNLNAHLEKAKKNNEEVMQKYHKLTETIFSGINFINEQENKPLSQENKAKLVKSLNNNQSQTKLFDTIKQEIQSTPKREIEVMDEADLFGDLKGSDDTIVIPPIDTKIPTSSAKPPYIDDSFEDDFEDTINISGEVKLQDTSFYSKSISFKQSDFDGHNTNGKNKVNIALSVLLAMIMLTILGICIYILIQIIN